MPDINLITIVGPTATGKTKLAARLAHALDSEVISADSRQVYRNMDLGTGKDYADYLVHGKRISSHLVDIVDAGTQYNVYEYQRDFLKVFEPLRKAGIIPVLCGGTGMYVEAVLKGYKLIRVPVNQSLREELEKWPDRALIEKLRSFKTLHNTTDITQRKRLIRAIEIEAHYADHPEHDSDFPTIRSFIAGVMVDRETRRRRITERLHRRLKAGMVDEVRFLLDRGIKSETLIYYGLEYKFIALYLAGELTHEQMVDRLNTAIHQYAKRQMTWFRGMEKRGFDIFWVDGCLAVEEQARIIRDQLSKQGVGSG
jgi:tRNA dimethylallyltransferase